MTRGEVLVCGGRAVDDRLRPHGQPCGRVYRGQGPADVHEQARAAGWSVALMAGAVHVTCDRCRRPDPAVTALLRGA